MKSLLSLHFPVLYSFNSHTSEYPVKHLQNSEQTDQSKPRCNGCRFLMHMYRDAHNEKPGLTRFLETKNIFDVRDAEVPRATRELSTSKECVGYSFPDKNKNGYENSQIHTIGLASTVYGITAKGGITHFIRRKDEPSKKWSGYFSLK